MQETIRNCEVDNKKTRLDTTLEDTTVTQAVAQASYSVLLKELNNRAKTTHCILINYLQRARIANSSYVAEPKDEKSLFIINKNAGNPKTGIYSEHGYYWIELKKNEQDGTEPEIFWITMFYNDIDTKTGNTHTIIGKIQFVKNIKGKSPNYLKSNKDEQCPLILCYNPNSFQPQYKDKNGYFLARPYTNIAPYTDDTTIEIKDFLAKNLIIDFLKFAGCGEYKHSDIVFEQ